MPNGITFGGPYYRSALRQQETQRRALTGKGYSPAEYAAISRGELEARYSGELEKTRYEEEKSLQERKLGIEEEAVEATSRAATMSGVGQLMGGAAALGGGAVMATGAAATAAGASLAAKGATLVGTASIGIIEAIGLIMAPLCCWTFLEGEMLTKNVRRYRDEHYDKFTSPISWGYRWMSTWIVPLMRIFKIVKFMIKFSMLKPLASYADWYYGENWYGWLFYPLKVFWTGSWKIAGLAIQLLMQTKVKEVF